MMHHLFPLRALRRALASTPSHVACASLVALLLTVVGGESAHAQVAPASSRAKSTVNDGATKPPVLLSSPLVTTPGEQADALHKKAKPLVAERRYDEAAKLLGEAFSLKPSHDIAANYGAVLLAMGRYRDAAGAFRVAREKMPTEIPAAQRRRFDAQEARARKKIAAVRIRVHDIGATVFVDGRAVGTSPIDHELFVDPGDHTFAAERGGRRTSAVDRNLVAGDDKIIDLGAVGDSAAGKAPAGAIALGVIGLVGIFTGAGLFGANVAVAAEHEEKATPLAGRCGRGGTPAPTPGFETPCKELADLRDESDAFVISGGVSIGVGSALLVAGIVWGTVDASHETVVTPVVSASSVGLVWGGTF